MPVGDRFSAERRSARSGQREQHPYREAPSSTGRVARSGGAFSIRSRFGFGIVEQGKTESELVFLSEKLLRFRCWRLSKAPHPPSAHDDDPPHALDRKPSALAPCSGVHCTHVDVEKVVQNIFQILKKLTPIWRIFYSENHFLSIRMFSLVMMLSLSSKKRRRKKEETNSLPETEPK